MADAGLIKTTVLLVGYQSPMEETVDELIDDLRQTESDGKLQVAGSAKGCLRQQDERG